MPYVDQYSYNCMCDWECYELLCVWTCNSDCELSHRRCLQQRYLHRQVRRLASRAITIDTVAPVPSGQIKQYLVDKGPLAVALGVGSSYGGGFDGQRVYRCKSDSGANHAVIIAGYSDAGGYWIVKNSWGATWNGDGYFKVGYGECDIETWVHYLDTPASAPSPTPRPRPAARRYGRRRRSGRARQLPRRLQPRPAQQRRRAQAQRVADSRRLGEQPGAGQAG